MDAPALRLAGWVVLRRRGIEGIATRVEVLIKRYGEALWVRDAGRESLLQCLQERRCAEFDRRCEARAFCISSL